MELDGSMAVLVAVDAPDLRVVPGLLSTFHCDRCSALLGDSMALCGELRSMEALVLLKVTDSVVLSDQTESEMEREMTSCLHRYLECSRCSCVLGSVVESAPKHLEVLRSVFLLHKENLNCYILKHSRMVKASDLVFDLKPMGASIEEVMKQFQAQSDHMSCVARRMRKQLR